LADTVNTGDEFIVSSLVVKLPLLSLPDAIEFTVIVVDGVESNIVDDGANDFVVVDIIDVVIVVVVEQSWRHRHGSGQS
jgi:ribosomal silencing factor RsfS